MADNIWIGNGDDKLYRQSGFTSTVKTSQSTTSEDGSPADVSYDGTNTIWSGNTNDKFWLWAGVFSTTLIDSQPHGAQANVGHPTIDGTNVPWGGNDTADGSKLYLFSGKITNTIKDSQVVNAIDTGLGGISWDGTNTPWCGLTGEKLYLQSGQFTSTLKTSEDIAAVNLNCTGISWDGTDTPWSGNTGDKLYLQSGQFTSTIKTSVDVGGIDNILMGIETFDFASRTAVSVTVTPDELALAATALAPASITHYPTVTPSALALTLTAETPVANTVSGLHDTFWADGQVRALFLQSGEFSTTIKASLSISAIENGVNGIAWDSTDTFAIGRTDDKMYKWSGVMTSTLKTSEPTSDINPHGISVDDTDTMWGADQINKLMWQSGKFTSTVKDSEDIFALDWSISSISWDGDNTPWCGQQHSGLWLTSGRFTSTIKTSHNVSSIEPFAQGITFNNPDTLFCGDSDDKLYKMQGQFSSTILTSLSTTTWGTAPRGIDTSNFDGRTSGILYATPDELTLTLALHAPSINIVGNITHSIASELTLSIAVQAPTISVDVALLLPDVPMPALEMTLSLYAPTIVTTNDVKTIVANSRNFAISEYSNFAFNSMGRLNGKSLYANASGIYEGGGGDDDGAKIHASYKTGAIDIFTTEKQLLRDAYLNYRSDGDIQLFSIGDEVNSRAYTITNSTSGTLHERRAKQERGIKDRHFSFGVSNINGSSLEIDTVRILTEPVRKRR